MFHFKLWKPIAERQSDGKNEELVGLLAFANKVKMQE
jgi:hypothetical protein